MQSPRYSIAHAVRGLMRARATTLVGVLTLGIGLSAAVALLGVFDGGTRSLPVPNGRDVVELDVRTARATKVTAPPPATWALGSGVDAAGALVQMEGTLAHTGTPAQRLTGAEMQSEVFALLHVAPALGRLPTKDPADANAVLIGWDTYRDMNGTPAMLGTRIDVDGVAHTLIGVMAASFGFPEKQSFWTVLPSTASGEVVARLAHGAHRDAVTQAVNARLSALQDPTLHASGVVHVLVQPWTRSRDNGGEGAVFGGLAVLVALLLVVCAANVATLLLVRGNERAGPLSIHAALGASRASIALQLFMEAVVVAVLGGMVGIGGGFIMLHWMQSHLAVHWGYYWMRMEVRPQILLATFGVVLVTAIIAGMAPALEASRIDLSRVLVGAGRGRYNIRQRRLGRWFVGAQVTFSTIGLIAAAYLTWGATRMARITTLLPMDRIAVASIAMPSDRFHDAASRAVLMESLRRELRTIPSVRVVSLSSAIPGGGGNTVSLVSPLNTVSATPSVVGMIAADAELTRAYDMRVLAGRSFTAVTESSVHTEAVVTPAFVRRHLKGAPVGQMIDFRMGTDSVVTHAEIVGVASDWFPDTNQPAADRIILPLANRLPAELYVSVRTTGPADAVLSDIRAAVARVDMHLPVSELQTLHARMNWMLRIPRVIAAFGALGGIASAIIAAIGLYGVMSFQVRSQLREIGVRMALGAGSRRIMTDIVRESMLRVAPGLLVGVALGLMMIPFVSRFAAAGTKPPSLSLLGAVVASMCVIGVASSLEPALRAARLDPQHVLRQD